MWASDSRVRLRVISSRPSARSPGHGFGGRAPGACAVGQHGLLVVFARHVDEVHDDDAAQVAQAQLARNGLRGLQVGLEDGVVEIARPT